MTTIMLRDELCGAFDVIDWCAAVAPPGVEASPYGWTSKDYVICVCFHCHGTSSYHTTNTLQDRRAKEPR